MAAAVGVIILAALLWRGLDGRSDGSQPGAGGDPAGLPSADDLGSPTVTPSPGQTEPGLQEMPTSTPKPVRKAIDEVAELGGGVSARVVRFESVQGESTGRGERDAPAVRFTVEITNDTSSDLDLRAATVTAYLGADQAPAPDLGAPGVRLFPASAAPGTTASGTFVFAIPPGERDDVSVHVGYRGEAPTAVFRGSVS
ncbi:hypothetical protein G7072_02620 [Nocardioides sp. HDW12B]|uniref:hypothetical protein n=1 Tax=Nocardioides sp. HDW12B TaxID=2714939 RepID=UPI00140CADF0|nr:hypothetical protein [Nocardioides sp. HDW12B]QIK65379.1 hypothetical protein G7072_02620 [Nocardioides sp. HDW12B]